MKQSVQQNYDSPCTAEFRAAFNGIDAVLTFYLDRAGAAALAAAAAGEDDGENFWMRDVKKSAGVLHAYIDSRVKQCETLANDEAFKRYNPPLSSAWTSPEETRKKLPDHFGKKGLDPGQKLFIASICCIAFSLGAFLTFLFS